MTVPLSNRIRQMGLESGFDAVGFARAEPVAPAVDRSFRRWLEKGHQASMAFMERHLEERLDPLLLLPEARSVIVVLSNYCRDNPTADLSSGKIARYAGGRDYHRVVGKELKRLCARIENEFPSAATWYEVDTGPVLERYWAQKAGLGWVGKNSLLLSKEFGSWTFIGIILTSLPLESDAPHADHCGSCTRCLEACPTGAFVEPGVLDSRRCISYWTIEHRGDLPADARSDLNGWFFGCDDCQTVCPWNRFARPTAHEDYHLRNQFRSPDLLTWAKITREEWDKLTLGTAIRRAGYEGFLRNSRNLIDSVR